jgi:hypothetical protein
MIRQHQISFKSILVSLGVLVVERLIDGAYATIQNSFHCWLSCPLGCRPRGDVSAKASLAFAVEKTKLFLVPAGLCPCGQNTKSKLKYARALRWHRSLSPVREQ